MKKSLSENKIPLVEEEITVSKRETETAKYLLNKTVETEEVNLNLNLKKQKVHVNRVAKNQEVEVAPQIRTENGVTIIPVIEEVAVVVKKLILKEEIHITSTENTEQFEQTETLRKEKIDIEKT